MMSEEQLLQRIVNAENRVQDLMQNRHAEYPSSIRGIAEYMTLREVYRNIPTDQGVVSVQVATSAQPNFAKAYAAFDYLAKSITTYHNETKSKESAALYNEMFDSNGLLIYSTAMASNDEAKVNEALKVMEDIHMRTSKVGYV